MNEPQNTSLNDRPVGLARAVEMLGGYAATARALGLKTAWAVQKWRRVPSDRVWPLVRATKGAVTAHELRPDLYPEGFVFPEPVSEVDERSVA